MAVTMLEPTVKAPTVRTPAAPVRRQADTLQDPLTDALTRPSAPVAAAPVQGDGDLGEDPAQVHAAAARGISGPASSLPHLDRIQAAFGRHSVADVQAHTGPSAAEGAAAMGARAFATGNHVAFGGAPDLHTAAHEAAHIVQQRGGVQLSGGVGAVGDKYEAHADAVAARVVSGGSAEGLLNGMSGGASADAPTQRAMDDEEGIQPLRDGSVQREADLEEELG